MRSSNPAFREDTFSGYTIGTDCMTINGVIGKTAILLLLTLLTAGWTWTQFFQSGGNPASVSGLTMAGLIVGFILAMVTVFKKEWAPVSAPLYALAEGLFLGGVSATFEASYPGIVIQATALTFGTLFAMLAAYRSGMIQPTERFKLGVVAATGGIAIVYLVSLVLGFFGMPLSFIFGSGLFGILFSLFVVCIAALNFILDFDLIEQGERRGAPKFMEWYCGFALMVTLIWLYIEFLRLISKLRER